MNYRLTPKNMKYIIIYGFLLFSTIGFSQFSFSGELRPRTEYRHGYKTLFDKDTNAATFVDQRTRLNFDYRIETYAFKLALQDIRTWGSQPQLNTTDGLTSVHEAWTEVLFNTAFSFKFGRQEISYDDQRIFGSVGWAQQARSHDAALIKYKDASTVVHAGFAYNQDRPSLRLAYPKISNYKAFQYLWIHKDIGNMNASFLFLNNGFQVIKTDNKGNEIDGYDNYSQTLGTRLEYKKNKTIAHFSGYYQFGVDGDLNNTKISAFNVSADLSYQISDTFTTTAGIEILSGNSEVNPSNKNKAFNPYYGTNHKFNGHMDYFYVGNHIGSVGLRDVFVRGMYKSKKFYLGGDIHLFSSHEDILNNGKTSDNYLGTEIDIYGGFNLVKGVALKAGYSQLFAGASMEFLKGGDKGIIQNWGWMMLIVKPKFL